MILLVFPIAKYRSPLIDGVFTPKLLLPARKGGQQQGALIICTKNVHLWHAFLAKGDRSVTFEIWSGGFVMEISILLAMKAEGTVGAPTCFV
jgi:hypothetical protein